MTPLAENLWVLSYPLKALGIDMHRNVTVMRLASGKVIIHSSAPFSPVDVAAIRALGDPAWLVDVMLRHDTFSQEGREAFPAARFLAPPGFEEHVKFPVHSILPPPPEWTPEISVLEIAGVPSMREVVFLHAPSRTLIVADLVMNFPGDAPFWKEMFLNLGISSDHAPGIPRTLKYMIKDQAAFDASIVAVLAWDFDRIIVGHGVPLERGGKEKLRHAFAEAGVFRSK